MTLTALVLPDPQVVAVAELRERLIPAIRVIREEVRQRGDLATADELRRRIEAFRRYVRDRQARMALEAEARRTELLIGHLLGPGERGGRHDLNEHTRLLPPRDRVRFRLLAAHEDEVRDEEHFARLAVEINDNRRQSLRKEQRQKVAGSLRQQGHSQRAIAEALGVSQPTINSDLKNPTDKSLSVGGPDQLVLLDDDDPDQGPPP